NMKHLFLFLLLFPTIVLGQKIIEMEERNGIFLIPCKVNGIPMKFIFDTGASDVSISITEAVFLIKQGLITENDIVGETQFTIANGNVEKGMLINLQSIEIDGIIIKNIVATVIDNDNAPLLLGQSVIQKLGRISFNGNQLILNDHIDNSNCTFYNLFPFEIGDTKFDISNTLNSITTIKEPSNELFKDLDDYEIGDKHIINLDYYNNLCIYSKDNHIQLSLVDDHLYMATISIRFEKNEYDLMRKQVDEIINYVPEEYKYISNFKITDRDTKEKIGEGINFYTESFEERSKVKIHKISIGYQAKYNNSYNSDLELVKKTNKIIKYVIYIDIVD
ncbi:MAG: retroviral-like aspartic protease family protein, partial [Flavobacteriaceae bacterium]|nr:retroviral-like aspartic protease family protein [Flavobacteriaceae bacterium]